MSIAASPLPTSQMAEAIVHAVRKWHEIEDKPSRTEFDVGRQQAYVEVIALATGALRPTVRRLLKEGTL